MLAEPDDWLHPALHLPPPAPGGVPFVLFASRFCAPGRPPRRVLVGVVATPDGVAHVEIDVADQVALGERLGITSTPTVLVLDADGVERSRASGIPTLAQARAALEAVSGR
ncbi:MAG: thioredoxin family protein [Cellulomonas sp.]|uniref:thioredoxin family protein n=1 Tax=Cellulomonas sp. TaxID=40001 RepID=UPI0017F47C4F|nr:thioredoxin family protein [Cellulomonas sp.]NMM31247.1 thioredoxin family protein [Cellulomonas sp.]